MCLSGLRFDAGFYNHTEEKTDEVVVWEEPKEFYVNGLDMLIEPIKTGGHLNERR